MPDEVDARFARYDRIIEQMHGFIAQQMVMNAHFERLHEDAQRFIREQQALNQVQLAHNEALYEMHAELRLAFVNLETRLGRIEALLERSLGGSTNGRGA